MKPISIEKFKGDFFKVLGGTDLSQVAVMTIEAHSDSGADGIHQGDQTVFILEGEGELEVEGEIWSMKEKDIAIIPKGKRHKMYNKEGKALFFLNIYTPPEY